MTRYVVSRLTQAVLVGLATSIVVFLVLRLIPGDPAVVLAGGDATPDQIAAVRKDLGLDKPLPVQYLDWLDGVLHGDLGQSYINSFPAATLIRSALPATLQLAVAGLGLGILLGIPLGAFAAARPGSLLDAFVTGFMTIGTGVPNFVLGLLSILVFALWLGWLPPSGRIDLTQNPGIGWKFLVLPACALAMPLGASLARFQRAAMREVLREDYVRTASAKGLRRSAVLMRHALPNAALPILTVLGLQFGQLLGGAVVVESVFAWPGMGRLLLQSVLSRDYVVVQSVLLLLSMVFVLVNLVVDLAYGMVDPRVRSARG